MPRIELVSKFLSSEWGKPRRTVDCMDEPSGSRLCQPGLVTTVAEKRAHFADCGQTTAREGRQEARVQGQRRNVSHQVHIFRSKYEWCSLQLCGAGTTVAWHHFMTATTPEDITGAGLLFLPNNVFFSEIDIK